MVRSNRVKTRSNGATLRVDASTKRTSKTQNGKRPERIRKHSNDQRAERRQCVSSDTREETDSRQDHPRGKDIIFDNSDVISVESIDRSLFSEDGDTHTELNDLFSTDGFDAQSELEDLLSSDGFDHNMYQSIEKDKFWEGVGEFLVGNSTDEEEDDLSSLGTDGTYGSLGSSDGGPGVPSREADVATDVPRWFDKIVRDVDSESCSSYGTSVAHSQVSLQSSIERVAQDEAPQSYSLWQAIGERVFNPLVGDVLLDRSYSSDGSHTTYDSAASKLVRFSAKAEEDKCDYGKSGSDLDLVFEIDKNSKTKTSDPKRDGPFQEKSTTPDFRTLLPPQLRDKTDMLFLEDSKEQIENKLRAGLSDVFHKLSHATSDDSAYITPAASRCYSMEVTTPHSATSDQFYSPAQYFSPDREGSPETQSEDSVSVCKVLAVGKVHSSNEGSIQIERSSSNENSLSIKWTGRKRTMDVSIKDESATPKYSNSDASDHLDKQLLVAGESSGSSSGIVEAKTYESRSEDNTSRNALSEDTFGAARDPPDPSTDLSDNVTGSSKNTPSSIQELSTKTLLAAGEAKNHSMPSSDSTSNKGVRSITNSLDEVAQIDKDLPRDFFDGNRKDSAIAVKSLRETGANEVQKANNTQEKEFGSSCGNPDSMNPKESANTKVLQSSIEKWIQNEESKVVSTPLKTCAPASQPEDEAFLEMLSTEFFGTLDSNLLQKRGSSRRECGKGGNATTRKRVEEVSRETEKRESLLQKVTTGDEQSFGSSNSKQPEKSGRDSDNASPAAMATTSDLERESSKGGNETTGNRMKDVSHEAEKPESPLQKVTTGDEQSYSSSNSKKQEKSGLDWASASPAAMAMTGDLEVPGASENNCEDALNETTSENAEVTEDENEDAIYIAASRMAVASARALDLPMKSLPERRTRSDISDVNNKVGYEAVNQGPDNIAESSDFQFCVSSSVESITYSTTTGSGSAYNDETEANDHNANQASVYLNGLEHAESASWSNCASSSRHSIVGGNIEHLEPCDTTRTEGSNSAKMSVEASNQFQPAENANELADNETNLPKCGVDQVSEGLPSIEVADSEINVSECKVDQESEGSSSAGAWVSGIVQELFDNFSPTRTAESRDDSTAPLKESIAYDKSDQDASDSTHRRTNLGDSSSNSPPKEQEADKPGSYNLSRLGKMFTFDVVYQKKDTDTPQNNSSSGGEAQNTKRIVDLDVVPQAAQNPVCADHATPKASGNRRNEPPYSTSPLVENMLANSFRAAATLIFDNEKKTASGTSDELSVPTGNEAAHGISIPTNQSSKKTKEKEYTAGSGHIGCDTELIQDVLLTTSIGSMREDMPACADFDDVVNIANKALTKVARCMDQPMSSTFGETTAITHPPAAVSTDTVSSSSLAIDKYLAYLSPKESDRESGTEMPTSLADGLFGSDEETASDASMKCGEKHRNRIRPTVEGTTSISADGKPRSPVSESAAEPRDESSSNLLDNSLSVFDIDKYLAYLSPLADSKQTENVRDCDVSRVKKEEKEQSLADASCLAEEQGMELEGQVQQQQQSKTGCEAMSTDLAANTIDSSKKGTTRDAGASIASNTALCGSTGLIQSSSSDQSSESHQEEGQQKEAKDIKQATESSNASQIARLASPRADESNGHSQGETTMSCDSDSNGTVFITPNESYISGETTSSPESEEPIVSVEGLQDQTSAVADRVRTTSACTPDEEGPQKCSQEEPTSPDNSDCNQLTLLTPTQSIASLQEETVSPGVYAEDVDESCSASEGDLNVPGYSKDEADEPNDSAGKKPSLAMSTQSIDSAKEETTMAESFQADPDNGSLAYTTFSASERDTDTQGCSQDEPVAISGDLDDNHSPMYSMGSLQEETPTLPVSSQADTDNGRLVYETCSASEHDTDLQSSPQDEPAASACLLDDDRYCICSSSLESSIVDDEEPLESPARPAKMVPDGTTNLQSDIGSIEDSEVGSPGSCTSESDDDDRYHILAGSQESPILDGGSHAAEAKPQEGALNVTTNLLSSSDSDITNEDSSVGSCVTESDDTFECGDDKDVGKEDESASQDNVASSLVRSTCALESTTQSTEVVLLLCDSNPEVAYTVSNTESYLCGSLSSEETKEEVEADQQEDCTVLDVAEAETGTDEMILAVTQNAADAQSTPTATGQEKIISPNSASSEETEEEGILATATERATAASETVVSAAMKEADFTIDGSMAKNPTVNTVRGMAISSEQQHNAPQSRQSEVEDSNESTVLRDEPTLFSDWTWKRILPSGPKAMKQQQDDLRKAPGGEVLVLKPVSSVESAATTSTFDTDASSLSSNSSVLSFQEYYLENDMLWKQMHSLYQCGTVKSSPSPHHFVQSENYLWYLSVSGAAQ